MNKKTTALVVIDLQKGIAAQPAQPYPAQEVVRNAGLLVAAFRKNGMPVCLVQVVSSPDTMLKVNSDQSFSRPGSMPGRLVQSLSRRSPLSRPTW